MNMKQQTNRLAFVFLLLTAQSKDAGTNEPIHVVSQCALQWLLQLQFKEKYPVKIPVWNKAKCGVFFCQ